MLKTKTKDRLTEKISAYLTNNYALSFTINLYKLVTKENKPNKSTRQLSDKAIQMAIKHMKRCTSLFMINEMQIKTAMRMPFFTHWIVNNSKAHEDEE